MPKRYRAPLLISLMLLGGLGLWAALEWNRIQRHHEGLLEHQSQAVFDALEGIIDSLNRYSPYHLNHLSLMLNSVVKTARLRFAVIQVNGTNLVTGGTPPENLAPAGTQGHDLQPGMFITWRRIQLKEISVFADGPGTAAAAGETYPLLVLGLDRTANAALLAEAARGLMVQIGIGLIGILGVCIIWMLSIHTRMLADELETARLQKAHFEELGLAAAGLAHEAKNPLGIIRGVAQRLSRETNISSDIRTGAEQIIDAVDRTSARLEEFMSYARCREPVRARVDLGRLMRELAAILNGDFKEAGIALTHTCPDNLHITADEDMLRQVLTNLLLNSLHASEAGTAVTADAGRQGHQAFITVADQGRGIEADLLSEVCKPYVSGTPQGHGLGLAIVQRIVQQHGWNLEIDSRPGAGTRVTVAGITAAPGTGHTA